MKNKKKILLFFVSSLFMACFCLSNNVFADGWIGTGTGTVSGGGSSGGSGCTPNDNRFRIDCAGVSWAQYSVSGSGAVNFPEGRSSAISPPSNTKIPAKCTQNGSKGFFHYGINAAGYKYKDGEGWDVWGGTNTWGHWMTIGLGTPSWAPEKTPTINGTKQKIKRGNTTIYKLKKFYTSAGALKYYKAAYAEENDGKEWTKNYIPAGTWGFCWYPDKYTVSVYAVDEYTKKFLDFTEVSGTKVGVMRGTSSGAVTNAEKTAKVPAGNNKEFTVWSTNTFDKANTYDYTNIVGVSSKRTNITNPSGVSFNSSTKKLTFNNVTKNSTVYVHYRRQVSVTIYAVDLTTAASPKFLDCAGNPVGGEADACSVTAKIYVKDNNSFNMGSVSKISGKNGYSLKGISKTLGVLGNLTKVGNINFSISGNTITIPKAITSFKTKLYANFKKGGTTTGNDVTLTVNEITNSGSPIGICGSKKVSKGSEASVTCPATVSYGGNDYQFQYFTNSSNGSRSGPTGTVNGRKYTEKISADTTRYAVYKRGGDDVSECPNSSNLLAEYVKNTSVSAYNSWMTRVYAKPGDNLKFCTSYNPSSPQGSGGYNYTNYEVVGSTCASEFPIGLAHSQLNDFLTKQSKGTNSSAVWGGSTVFTNIGIPGSTARREQSNNYNNIPTSEVGKTIDERAETRGRTPTRADAYTLKSPDGTTTRGQCVKWVCVDCYSYSCNCVTSCSGSGESYSCSTSCDTCYKDTYYHYSRGYPASTNTYYSNVAQAHVPYNFETATEITSPTDDTEEVDTKTGHHIVYAGETEEVRFTFDINARYNSTTDGDYATKIDDSKRQLEISYGGNTYYTNVDTETLYNTSITGMDSYSRNYSREIIIPDLPAGTEITVRSMVYPATSGAETNWTDKNGDHRWAYSEPVTYVIAKRPSLDVWGGNVFNNSEISTSTAVKYQLDGVTSYSPDKRNRNTAYIFGSWGELGTISNDSVRGMASGASLAKDRGSVETSVNYQRRVPLNFANYPTVAALGQSAANNRFNQDRDRLLAKYFFEDTEVPDIEEEDPPLNDNAYDVGNNVFYYHSANDLFVTEHSIDAGTTQVVFSEENVNINGNLTYGSDIDGRRNYLFGNFINVPKLIVYAKNEIRIACGVNRIDAVLIAEKVITCADSSNDFDENIIVDPTNSNRLVVFGAVITNTLVANRTYGAEPGVNGISSTSPAEIIIFDPTLYRLENNTDDASQTEAANADTKLVTTYLKELSPRY